MGNWGGARKGSGRKPGKTSEFSGPALGRTISLRTDEWERIDREAELHGLTRSTLIRRAIRQYFETRKDSEA